ncbi:SDR family NAD(P)-dependent oxidoreductase [Novosphingobium rosa]|uniref:SDR family NAD(P)-dependent oxidoreductase n=1 Tax=Novosphingobium rosa TaxID=76978 RepID=UPI00082BA03E|nr:SDR family NAD(P)-dependent oxidoreductase [Novosphingobium rosa]
MNDTLNMETLRGRVAVVTGAATGMGRGIAEVLRDAGMRVVIADIEEERLRATAAEIGVDHYRLDVSIGAEVERFAANVFDKYGSIDVLCNNAGVGPIGSIGGLSLEDWKWVLDVNLWGVIHGVHAFLPFMKRSGRASSIVNTASMSGLLPGPQFGPYTVSKYGVVGITEVLALELAMERSPIRASVLLPGPTQTAIATSLRNRPDERQSGLANLDLAESDIFPGGIPWKTPRQIGEVVLNGVLTGELYLFTHPQLSQPIFDRFDAIREANDRATAFLASLVKHGN